LFKQVKEAGCIGEDHDIAEECGSDQPNLLKPGEIVILIVDLLDSNHCLNHIETHCIDGVHEKNREDPYCEELSSLRGLLKGFETSIGIFYS
jgi:hypothetical protein